ncbi:hypothetical protein K474DRAFT_1774086 [Panus rudis PR-1116 ss-1]|nr:hypothetical protein K474DRAFT_1774086 [Panus rudis PR-1116 ss-1]
MQAANGPIAINVNDGSSRMHRRKSSKDEDDNLVVTSGDAPEQSVPAQEVYTFVASSSAPDSSLMSAIESGLNGHGSNGFGLNGDAMPEGTHPTRSRVNSTPSIPPEHLPPSHSHPPSAGPYRTSFSIPPRSPAYSGSHLQPPAGRYQHQAPAMRQSLSLPSHTSSHSRTRSVSGPFTPATPSPLSSSFPSSSSSPFPSKPVSPTMYRFPGSSTESDLHVGGHKRVPSYSASNGITPSTSSSSTSSNPRRHSRLHSRNLSIFFPKPGSLPSTSIAEDGAQEVDFPPSNSEDLGVLIPAMSSPAAGQRTFREGFRFGSRPVDSEADDGQSPPGEGGTSRRSRRGHHHKHSLSHNFFSFLEPGEELVTNPTPTPVSPWNPGSQFPKSPGVDSDASSSNPDPRPISPESHPIHLHSQDPIGTIRADPDISPIALAMTVLQFSLGAALWVSGQHIGSLACTGLGYWVVFDSFGVALRKVIPSWLAKPHMKDPLKRPFGNARLETLLIYAQSIFLVFTSVYVCKETVEHLLLSSGEGHHHHNGDEVSDVFGIEFPPYLLFVTLISLLVSAIGFDNHAKFVSIANNHIPPIHVLLPARYRYRSPQYPSYLANLLSNPYTLSPVLFCAAIMMVHVFLPPHRHRDFDLALAAIQTVVTFQLAYPAAVALGSVLLQTAPSRGLPGGRMEAFARVIREIERHPKVSAVLEPHIWQLTPPLIRPSGYGARHPKALGPAQRLVVTFKLRLGDDEKVDGERDLSHSHLHSDTYLDRDRKNQSGDEITDREILEITRWARDKCANALRLGMGEGDGGECEAHVSVGFVIAGREEKKSSLEHSHSHGHSHGHGHTHGEECGEDEDDHKGHGHSHGPNEDAHSHGAVHAHHAHTHSHSHSHSHSAHGHSH